MAAAVPQRRCLASGESAPADELLRFVVGPDGDVVPDVAGRLPGRGLWVRSDRALLERAVSRGLFARAARGRAQAPRDLPGRTESLLARRCADLLGLARRAGQVEAGFDAVANALDRGRAAALVTASDARPHGRRKLGRRASHLPQVACLTSAELGLALGRESVVHAAVAPGRCCQRFLKEAYRLGGIRSEGGTAAAESSHI